MNSKERMLAAMQNKKPDRTPVAPDMSNMIPARMSGHRFYDIYLNNKPELWRCYIDAVNYYGIDGWFIYGDGDWKSKSEITAENDIRSSSREAIHTKTVIHTPQGDLFSETKYPFDQPPTITRGLIKNLKEDLPKIKYLFPEILSCGNETYRKMHKALGNSGVCGVSIGYPGYQFLVSLFDNKLSGVVFSSSDYPEEFEELHQVIFKHQMQKFEMCLECLKPDFILLGGSGSITLASVKLFRKYALPFIREATHKAKEAGIPTMLHSCGKEKELVAITALETELDCVNPLEVPPMGDCNLKEIKRLYGDRIALMGNLHTTEIMLKGTPEQVKKASLQAIEDAGYNGGFILSTGDQCGRDTPDENIFAMVQAANEYTL